jgi:hypothetical protein
VRTRALTWVLRVTRVYPDIRTGVIGMAILDEDQLFGRPRTRAGGTCS